MLFHSKMELTSCVSPFNNMIWTYTICNYGNNLPFQFIILTAYKTAKFHEEKPIYANRYVDSCLVFTALMTKLATMRTMKLR